MKGRFRGGDFFIIYQEMSMAAMLTAGFKWNEDLTNIICINLQIMWICSWFVKFQHKNWPWGYVFAWSRQNEEFIRGSDKHHSCKICFHLAQRDIWDTKWWQKLTWVRWAKNELRPRLCWISYRNPYNSK